MVNPTNQIEFVLEPNQKIRICMENTFEISLTDKDIKTISEIVRLRKGMGEKYKVMGDNPEKVLNWVVEKMNPDITDYVNKIFSVKLSELCDEHIFALDKW